MKLFSSSFGMPRVVTKNAKRTGLWFGVGILTLAGLVNVSPAGSEQSEKTPAAETSKKERQIQREGSKLVASIGYFRQASGRFTFVAKESPKTGLVCVENLMLQRVSDALSAQTEFSEWQVSGEYTEYRGANYLVLKTAQRVD